MVKSLLKTNKSELRKHYLSLRNNHNKIARYFHSRQIAKRLLNLAVIKDSQVIAVYIAMEQEVDLKLFIKKAWGQNKIIVIPRIENKTMVFHQITNFDYPFAIWKGLKVPHQKLPIYDLTKIDTMIVPGVAFDGAGHRIGFGAGFYDRYLNSNTKTTLIGAAFNFQIYDQDLPNEKHDVVMNYVMTESKLIKVA